MSNKSGSGSSSLSLQIIANLFRQTGWAAFILQLVLTIPAVGILLFAGNRVGNPIAFLFTISGVLILVFTIYWSFRYIIVGRRLRDPLIRPKKSETVKMLRTGLLASLAGMFLALIGQGAILGVVAQKAFSQGIGGFINTNVSQFVQPSDILVVQSSFNVVTSHFVGIASALWLLYRMNRQ